LLKDVQYRRADVLFEREHTLDLGDVRVKLLSLGSMHTRGDTMLFVEEGPGGSETADFVGPGYRYLTVQIFDADQSMQDIVARGGRIAREAVSFKDIARYGFVKDPDGNWIEMSARASLTGVAPK
jgi:predicted enzyme related to lactoylglutathione lyase